MNSRATVGRRKPIDGRAGVLAALITLAMSAALWADRPDDPVHVRYDEPSSWLDLIVDDNASLFRWKTPDEVEAYHRRSFVETGSFVYSEWLEGWDREAAERVAAPTIEYDPAPATASIRARLDATPGVYVIFPGVDRLTRLVLVRSFSLAVHERLDHGWVAFAVDSRTRKPLEGLELQLIDRLDRVRATTRTGADGVARFEPSKPGEDLDPSGDERFLLLARRADDVRGVILSAERSQRSRILVTTDRPLYRPGDTVHFKFIARDRAASALALPERQRWTARWLYGDYSERVLATVDCEVTPYGTAHGSFDLPPETRTGTHVIEVDGRRCTFRVEPYRKPELLTSVSLELDGDTPVVVVDARYAFGGAVGGAEVDWTLYHTAGFEEGRDSPASALRVPFEDPHFDVYDVRPLLVEERIAAVPAFGLEWMEEDAYEEWDLRFIADWADPIEEEAGVADANGQLRIELPEELSHGTVVIDGTVTDSARYAVPFRAVLDLPDRDTSTITAGFDDLYLVAGEASDARCRVVTRNGEPVAGARVEFALLAPHLNPDAELEWEWLDGGVATTDENGYARHPITPPSTGRPPRVSWSEPFDWGQLERDSEYRLRVRRVDEQGVVRTAPVRVDVPCFDLNLPVDALPEAVAKEDPNVRVLPHRWVVPDGESIRLVVETNFSGEGWLLVSGGAFEVLQRLSFDRSAQRVEIPYGEEWGPSVHVGVLSLSEGYAIEDYKVVYRDPSSDEVDLRLEFADESYRPGESARLRVTTRTSDSEAGAVPCELEIGIVDEAIYQLREREAVHPGLIFRMPQSVEDQIASNWLGPRPRSIYGPQLFGFSDGGGIFDLGDDEGGGSVESGPRARERFSDTWYWTATAETDANGELELELPVPDDLTEWRVVARAVSGAEKFGLAISETRTRQPVLVRWVIPSPLRKGDRPTMALIAHNHGGEPATFDLEWAVSGPITTADGEREGASTVTIDAHGSVRLDLPMVCRDEGTVEFDATLVREGAPRKPLDPDSGDRLRLTRTIASMAQPRVDARHGRLSEAWSAQWTLPEDHVAGTASLELQVSISPLDEVAGVLPSLIQYPYGCVEQTMSRFLPALIAQQAAGRTSRSIDLPDDLDSILRAGIDRLSHLQHDDGGWGWWTDDETDLGMTRYVLAGLLLAHDLDVAIEPSVIERGLEFLFGWAREESWTPEELALIRLAKTGGWLEESEEEESEFTTSLDGPRCAEQLAEELARWAKDADGREALDGTARAYLVLAGLESDGSELTGALPETGYRGISEAALRLRALSRVNPTHPFVPELVEFLLANRLARGWNTTLDTAHVVHALASLPVGSKESLSGLRASVNGQPVEWTDQRARVALSSAGPITAVVAATGIDSSDGVFPPTVHAQLRYSTESTLERAFASSDGTTIEREIEYWSDESDVGGGWLRVGEGDEIPVGTLLRVRCVVSEGRAHEYTLTESPLIGGWAVVPDPDEMELWVNARFDRVLFDRAYFAGRTSDVYYARVTVPGRYRLTPARWFAMYDPKYEAMTASQVITVVDRK